jgi:hypothetical protein
MAINLKNVHQRGVANIAAAYEDAQAEYRQAALAGDEDAAAAAALRLAGLEAMADKFNGMASRAMAAPATPPNKWGLSETEEAIAKNSFGPIKDSRGNLVDMTDDQKCELYSQNKQKYRRAVADGSYSTQVKT